jgi:hypothetical protein
MIGALDVAAQGVDFTSLSFSNKVYWRYCHKFVWLRVNEIRNRKQRSPDE